MLTKSERLQNKIGQKVTCDSCGKKQILTEAWRMNDGKDILCPACSKDYKGLLVSF